MARKKLGEILIQAGILDETRLRVALREQQRWGGPLGRHLIELRLLRESDLVMALSMQLNIPAAPDLLQEPPTSAALDLLPLEFCEEHTLCPFRTAGKFLDVALCDPTNLSVLDEVRIRTKLNVRPHIIGPNLLEKVLSKYYKGLDLEVPVRAPSGAIGAVLPTPVVMNVSGGQVVEFKSNPRATAPSTDPALEQLQKRVTELEGFLARDEAVIRKLLGLLIETGLMTREQVMTCLSE